MNKKQSPKAVPNDRIAIRGDVCQGVRAGENYSDKGPVDSRTETVDVLTETGDSVGFLLRPASCRAEPSWAEARFLVQASPLGEPSRVSGRVTDFHPVLASRWLRVELLYARGGAGGKAIELELSDEAGLVSVISRLGDSAPAARQAGA